ncbi:MAG: dockerin type I repeat-containing protein [Clostridiales bacterium]|nr:dockerin type I repeat-containing protein [Clostridiales bacterium]
MRRLNWGILLCLVVGLLIIPQAVMATRTHFDYGDKTSEDFSDGAQSKANENVIARDQRPGEETRRGSGYEKPREEFPEKHYSKSMEKYDNMAGALEYRAGLEASMPWPALLDSGMSGDADDLAAEINSWGIGLIATVAGDTVTVNGVAAGQNAARILTLSEKVTLDWKATYSGKVSGEESEWGWSQIPMLSFYGYGTLIISGGTIANSGDHSVALVVAVPACSFGASVKIEASGIASEAIYGRIIWNEEGDTAIGAADLTISGAEVIAADATAVFTYGNVDVTGGLVQSPTGAITTVAIAATLIACDVSVSGGIVRATGESGFAIQTNGDIKISGGLIETLGDLGNAIYCRETWNGEALVKTPEVTVSGGEVKTGGGWAHAITTAGTVMIRDEAKVVTGGYGSDAIVSGGNVTISGGRLQAEGEYGYAINTGGDVAVSGGLIETLGENGHALNCWEIWEGDTLIKTPLVTLSGGEVKSGGIRAHAVLTAGPVLIRDEAKLVAAGFAGDTVFSAGNVTVSGGWLQAEGELGYAINTGGDVSVSGGLIETGGDYGNAINCWASWENDIAVKVPKVIISGGVIKTAGELAIAINTAGPVTIQNEAKVVTSGFSSDAIFPGDEIIVSGGLVQTAGDSASAIKTGSDVTVSGGLVETLGDEAVAIYCWATWEDDIVVKAPNVIVSGGEVVSVGESGYTIATPGKVTVNGGAVLGIGLDLTDIIIILGSAGSFLGPTEGGIVIAYDKGETSTYYSGTTADLITWPAGAKAAWAQSGGRHGISYENGSNSGFIAIPGIIVIGDSGDKPVLVIKDAFAQAGGTVTVSYSIEGNALGITTFTLEIPYDSSIYKPVAVDPVNPGSMLGHPLNGILVANPAFGGKDMIRLSYASSAKVDGDGLLFSVTYQIGEAAYGDEKLTVSMRQFTVNRFENKFEEIDSDLKTGTLIIGIMGDIDGDGIISPEDAILLLQMYVGIIEWTPRALFFGDINKDGVVDPVDAALILRMVVGG